MGFSKGSSSKSKPPKAAREAFKGVYAKASAAANQPYTPYTGQLVAGMNSAQTGAIKNLKNAQSVWQPYVNASAQYAAQGAAPVADKVPQWSEEALQQYMSPYQQQVIDATLANINKNNAIQQNDLLGKAIQSGASPFGGDRAGVAAAELARNQAMSRDQTIANLLNQGYNTALGAFQNNQNLQANMLSGDAQRALAASGQLGNLGGLASSSVINAANALMGAGNQQQQTQQAQLNAQYQQFLEQRDWDKIQAQWLASVTGQVAPLMAGHGTKTYTPGTLDYLNTAAGFIKTGGRVDNYASGGGIQPRFDDDGFLVGPLVPPSGPSEEGKEKLKVFLSSAMGLPVPGGGSGTGLGDLVPGGLYADGGSVDPMFTYQDAPGYADIQIPLVSMDAFALPQTNDFNTIAPAPVGGMHVPPAVEEAVERDVTKPVTVARQLPDLPKNWQQQRESLVAFRAEGGAAPAPTTGDAPAPVPQEPLVAFNAIKARQAQGMPIAGQKALGALGALASIGGFPQISQGLASVGVTPGDDPGLAKGLSFINGALGKFGLGPIQAQQPTPQPGTEQPGTQQAGPVQNFLGGATSAFLPQTEQGPNPGLGSPGIFNFKGAPIATGFNSFGSGFSNGRKFGFAEGGVADEDEDELLPDLTSADTSIIPAGFSGIPAAQPQQQAQPQPQAGLGQLPERESSWKDFVGPGIAGLAFGLLSGNPLVGLAAGLGSYNKQRRFEQQLDARPSVDSSGPTIRFYYPSERKWIDTGIPSADFGLKQAQTQKLGMDVQATKSKMDRNKKLSDLFEGAFADTVGALESGSSGYTARNAAGSGAFGRYQFMPATWADLRAKNPDLGLPEDLTAATPEQQDAAFRVFTDGNRSQLSNTLGRDATDIDLYLAHRFGPAGATKLLQMDPSTPIADAMKSIFGDKAGAVITQNPDVARGSIADFIGKYGQKFQGAPAAATRLDPMMEMAIKVAAINGDFGRIPELIATGQNQAYTRQVDAQRLANEQERVRMERERIEREKRKDDPNYQAEVEGKKARAKEEAEREAVSRTNVQGAQTFLQKLGRIREIIEQGGDDMFGPIQGHPVNQFAGSVLGTETQKRREELNAALRDVELSIAQMKLKGQGQVTEAERKIAREMMPLLTTTDSATALKILDGLSQEAKDTLERAGVSTEGAGPTPGTVMDGYRFKGGNPADESNWEKVQ